MSVACRFSVLAAAAIVAAACSRDHSALEQEPTGSGGAGGRAEISASVGLVGTTAGAGGAGGNPSSGGGAEPSTSSGEGGEGGEGAGGTRPEEPPGPTRIVVVHGLSDRDHLGFCFATLEGEGVDAPPFPDGGLAFAGVADVDPAVLPASGETIVMLVSGDEDDLDDASCADVLSDPGSFPDLEIAALGVVPGEALSAPRILVLAATGCLGGEDHENELMEQACGVGYGPFSPTAALVAASPSRIAPADKVGFQSIGASLPSAPFDVLLRPDLDGVPFLVTEDLSWGASAPFPPSHDRDDASVGVPSQLGAIVTLPNDDDTVLAEIDLADAAERAGINTFVNGEAITIAFVGASPGLGDGPWWHAFDAVLIPKDPE